MELPNDYICEGQMSIWDCFGDATPLKFDPHKELRLIELFAGIGSQAMSLRNIGVPFTHYKIVEFDRFACASYNAIHGTDFPVMDITKITGKDLEIVEKYKYTYLLTYLLVSLHRFISSRCYERYGRRKRHKVKPSVGSEETT